MAVSTYELVVVLDANKTDDEIQQSLKKIEDVITSNEGTIVQKDEWGKKRFAYPIEKKRDGYYTLYHFDSVTNNECLPELNRHLRIEEDILRSLVTKAVIGKSKGNPALAEEFFAQRAAAANRNRQQRRERFEASSGGGDSRSGSAPAPASSAPSAPSPSATTESPTSS